VGNAAVQIVESIKRGAQLERIEIVPGQPQVRIDFALAEIERALVAIGDAGGRVLRPEIAVPEEIKLLLWQQTGIELAGHAEHRGKGDAVRQPYGCWRHRPTNRHRPMLPAS